MDYAKKHAKGVVNLYKDNYTKKYEKVSECISTLAGFRRFIVEYLTLR